MKRFSYLILVLLILIFADFIKISAQPVPSTKTIESLALANKYFILKWPDAGQTIMAEKIYPSNFWIRSFYYEGLMEYYKINPNPEYLKYALAWGEFHNWGLIDGVETRSSENQFCGQAYIELYMLDRYKEERIRDIRACIDNMLATDITDDWSSTDAVQMSMPVYARLGKIYNNEKYFDRMHEMYLSAKQKLYNEEDNLWWRDNDFVPPYKEPNGKNCYWSRGNGWVVAALVRTIDFLPKNGKYKKEYVEMLTDMFETLVPLQRDDGFWNVSLLDPDNFGGREMTGTALFIYGMAWAINQEIISKKDYLPVVNKAWNAILEESLHPDGSLGYVQGNAKGPKDGQPLGFDIVPDYEDLGLGCFLLAGTEMYKLNKAMEPKVKEPKVKEPKVKEPKVKEPKVTEPKEARGSKKVKSEK